jgi:hypothetical protein
LQLKPLVKEKVMKKKFSALSKKGQAKVEAEYHRMKPGDLDDVMAAATKHTPNAVRLPSRLVEKLKTVAERKGKVQYEIMVKTWIEERLQEEVRAR